MYSSLAFSTFTMLCDQRICVVPKPLRPLEGRPVPITPCFPRPPAYVTIGLLSVVMGSSTDHTTQTVELTQVSIST